MTGVAVWVHTVTVNVHCQASDVNHSLQKLITMSQNQDKKYELNIEFIL